MQKNKSYSSSYIVDLQVPIKEDLQRKLHKSYLQFSKTWKGLNLENYQEGKHGQKKITLLLTKLM